MWFPKIYSAKALVSNGFIKTTETVEQKIGEKKPRFLPTDMFIFAAESFYIKICRKKARSMHCRERAFFIKRKEKNREIDR